MVGVATFIITVASMSFMAGVVNDITSVITDDSSMDMVIHSVIDLLAEFKQAQLYDQEKIKDEAFMRDINERLNEFSGFLITEVNGEFNSFGSNELSSAFYNKIKSFTTIKPIKAHGMDDERHVLKEGSNTYFIIKHEFEDNEASIFYYIVIDVTEFDQLSKNYGQKFLAMMIVIVFLIILPLTYILTKDIIKPLKKLEKGALNIKAGYLDFSLESKGSNEIGRVINAFEKMRSELKKSIVHQIQVEENRKELISSISHDLKTPITSIKGYVEGIQDGVANSPEKLARYLEVIYQKSEDMDRLIDDLFLYSKLDLHRVPFDMEQVMLKPFFNSCIEELRLEYEKLGIIINSNYFCHDQQVIVMDSQKIKRVILNIINNSLKFMEKDNKRIDISFQEENEHIIMSITDNGAGIDPLEIDKIFERFYRSDPSRNTNTGGSGLGLAIAKQIVEQHGGIIFAESVPNEWTTISIRLPYNKENGSYEQ
jgi:signal transduction histidine kinase